MGHLITGSRSSLFFIFPKNQCGNNSKRQKQLVIYKSQFKLMSLDATITNEFGIHNVDRRNIFNIFSFNFYYHRLANGSSYNWWQNIAVFSCPKNHCGNNCKYLCKNQGYKQSPAVFSFPKNHCGKESQYLCKNQGYKQMLVAIHRRFFISKISLW